MRIKDRFNLFFDSLSIESLKTLGKRLLLLSVVLFILLSLFLINAVSPSAHGEESVSFPPVTFSSDTSSFTTSNAFSSLPTFVTISFTSGSSFRYTFVTSVSDTFVFAISRNVGSRPAYSLYAVSVNSSSSSDSLVYFQDVGSSVYRYAYSLNTLDSSSSTYYRNLFDLYTDNGNVVSPIDFPIFSSLSTALSSFRTWYDNGGADPVDPVSSSFSLPAGYVAYVDIGSGSEYDLFVKANFGYNSSFGITTPQTIFGNTGQRFGWVSDLPSGSVQFPNGSVDTQFSWYKEAPTNLLGQSKAAGSPLHGSASSRYLVLYNPFYQPFKVGGFNTTPVSSARQNPTLIVSGTGISGVKIYPLNQTSFFPDSVSVIYPDSIPLDGSPPEGGGTIDFTDPDGQIVVPSPGGDNAPLDDSSDTDIFSGFFGRIIGILTNGFDAIRRLTSESSSFFNFLSNLWSWLPPELSAFFISAVILIVIVGFFKAFL